MGSPQQFFIGCKMKWTLCLLCVASVATALPAREPKMFSLFSVVTFPNAECTTDSTPAMTPQTLVRFVRAFRDRVSPEQRPIVVHCSAGVGRSGTFIALDRILQGIRKYDVVDIFGIVYEMRKERVWMVQTEQQYICIHQCLLTVLEGKEHDERHERQLHDNEAFEDDEGIAESGM